jgi:4-amino-4-deoxy-L-arabinose transferase-like glycosyltransferase
MSWRASPIESERRGALAGESERNDSERGPSAKAPPTGEEEGAGSWLGRHRLHLLLALLVLVTVHWLFGHRLDDPFGARDAEVLRSLKLATGDSIAPILDAERGVKPPLYPLALYLTNGLGLPLARCNELALVGLLLALGWLGLRHWPPRTAVALVVVSSLLAPFYFHFALLRGEAFFAAFALASLVATLRYYERPDARRLAWLAATAAGASLSRYMGLYWLVPLIALNLLLIHRDDLVTASRRAALFVAGAALPVLAYMARQYQKTGHWTGMERFSERRFVQRMYGQDYGWLGNFEFNVPRMGRYTLADFGVLGDVRAAHDFPQSSVEWQLGLLLALFAGLLVWTGARFLFTLAREAPPASALEPRVALRFLSIEYYLSFMAITTVIWTFSNNDPITSRFLVPGYPFLLLAAFASYDEVRAQKGWVPFAHLLAFGVVVVVQLARLDVFEHLFAAALGIE